MRRVITIVMSQLALVLLSIFGVACTHTPTGTPPPFEQSLPAAGSNNIWYSQTQSDTAIVFVHGILSDSRGCWWYQDPDDRSRNNYWPEIVKHDSALASPSVYMAGYYADVDSGMETIRDAAQQVWQGLSSSQHGPSLLASKRRILFITHSTGGIVTRYLLETHAEDLKDHVVGLMLIASPSGGSESADALKELISYYDNELGRSLMTDSAILADIDRRFRETVDQNSVRFLAGVEAFEHHRILHRRWLPPWPFLERLQPVTRASASHYFGDARLLEKTDHFGTVKPDSENHPAHRLLVEFYKGKFARVSERAAALLDHPIVSSDRNIEIDATNASTLSNKGDIEAHRLVVRDTQLMLRPKTVIQADEIEMVGKGRIVGTDITLRVGRISGGAIIVDGAPGAPGKPGGAGGQLLLAGITITKTLLSARGGNGGNALQPEGTAGAGGPGGTIFVASANTLEPQPDVDGGADGDSAKSPGPPGRVVYQRFADPTKANAFMVDSGKLNFMAALASATPPGQAAVTKIDFAGDHGLSDAGRNRLDLLADALMKDEGLALFLQPRVKAADYKLQLGLADSAFAYLRGKGVNRQQLVAFGSTDKLLVRDGAGPEASAWFGISADTPKGDLPNSIQGAVANLQNPPSIPEFRPTF